MEMFEFKYNGEKVFIFAKYKADAIRETFAKGIVKPCNGIWQESAQDRKLFYWQENTYNG
jgi:hypothetical protein|tara:strand:- start:677 stop:856 length:180 start_codon:yes stop_codon:yes gene_type:complete